MKIYKKLLCFITLAYLAPLSFSETLLEIYEQALENDPLLRADKAAYEAGKENYKIARAALLPTISASAGYTDSDGESESSGAQFINGIALPSAGGTTFSESDGQTTSYGASLRQPLFDMSSWYSFKQGAAQSQQAEANFKSAQQDFIIRVSEAYINILRAIDNLESALANETALESQLEQIQQRFEVGLTAITDVLDARSRYDSAVATVFQARGNLGIVYEQLEVLTGNSYNEIAPLIDTFPVADPTPSDRQEWVDFALENNSDLQSAKFSEEASGFSAKARKSDHLPTLTGTISYNHSDQDTEQTTFNDAIIPPATSPEPPTTGVSNFIREGTSVEITLNIPIYSGGGTSARRRQAYQNYIQAQEQYNFQYRNTIQNTRSLYLQVTTDVAQVNARQQAVISAQSALEANQAGYEVGTRNIVDVLLAQQTLFQAQFQYSDALYNYIINNLRLKQTAGILTPQDVIELNQWLDQQNQINRERFEQQ